MGDRAAALDKVRKLLALSKSANEHEAAAAALAAARILADYRLTEADLNETAIGERHWPLPSEAWTHHLAATVAAGCGCRLVVAGDLPRRRVPEHSPFVPSLTGIFVGASLDTETATRLFSRLEVQIRRLMDSGWKQHVADLTDPHYGVYPSLLEEGAEAEWKASFALGAVEVVRAKLFGLDTDAREASEATALMRVSHSREVALSRATQYTDQKWPTARPALRQPYVLSLGGLKAGQQTDVD